MKKLLIAATAAIAIPAFADQPSYSYIEAGYFDAGEVDGYSIGGSASLGENWHIFAGGAYGEADVFGESVDVDTSGIGIGYHAEMGDTSSWYVEAGWIKADISTDFGNFDDTGYGVSLGMRNMLSDQFEAGASIDYANIFNSGDTDVSGYIQYHATESVGIILDASSAEGYDYGIGVRVNF